MDAIDDLVKAIRRKGVMLCPENGLLRYKAPRGVLTEHEIRTLGAARCQILSFLESEAAREALTLDARGKEAPLAFSQLAHWNLHRLGERHTFRQVASATRLCGRLDLGALRDCLAEVVRHHSALRTGIELRDGSPIQIVSAAVERDLEIQDLTRVQEGSREAELGHCIEQFLGQPIRFDQDSLFNVIVVKLDEAQHVLITAMEHLVSDAFSRKILLRDLFQAYTQAVSGNGFSLPPVSTSFADYAFRQRTTAGSWIRMHRRYWNTHLLSCPRSKLPRDFEASERAGWGIVPLRIGGSLRAELRNWCRTKKTTLVLGIFTAYVALVLRWCNDSDAVVQFQFDSRVSREMENTIGYVASMLYLRLSITPQDGFSDLLNHVTEEYCKAQEHADQSYLAARAVPPAFISNTVFNWIPQAYAADHEEVSDADQTITCSAVPFKHPMLKSLELDREPVMMLWDGNREIMGRVYFPRRAFADGSMERFAGNFIRFLYALVRAPDLRVTDVPLS